ncbi:MAG TPA: class I SAM-dependent methyltransferase [Blastocatellia bacterium]|nr:class I SAM-dependent methyltransferase [Blastocatellia bacterium]
MNKQQAEEILKAWSESAGYWDKHQETLLQLFHPVTERLIRTAGISAGHSVLDVAGGAGQPSLTIAQVVGPTGSVVYTDAVPEMTGVASRQAERKGLTNISFHTATASQLPFASSSFDAAVCRFGIMFFPDPLAACREVLRVIKPGGRIAFAVWHTRDSNPFLGVVANALDHYFEPAPEGPESPGAFRFAKAGTLAALLNDAGARRVAEELFEFKLQAPLTVDEFWTLRREISDSLRGKLKLLSPERALELEAQVKSAAAKSFDNNRMSFPASVVIVSGVKM